MVVLDTSILIDALRQFKGHDPILREFIGLDSEDDLAISVLTIQELYAGKSSKDLKKEKLILAVISSLETLPYTYEVAKLAGEIARDADKSLGFQDAAIAAAAILNKAKLLTLNKKDFKEIKNLKLI